MNLAMSIRLFALIRDGPAWANITMGHVAKAKTGLTPRSLNNQKPSLTPPSLPHFHCRSLRMKIAR